MVEALKPTVAEQPALDAGELAVTEREGGNGGVAVLLTIAAVLAAMIGWYASVISSQANDLWQSSLRTTEKRDAAAMNDIQQLYLNELPAATRILQARVLARELAAAEAGKSPEVVKALQVEAGVQEQLTKYLPSVPLGSDPYALGPGGFDLGKRLADLRSSDPGLASLDPDAKEAQGDALAHKAVLMSMTLLPVSLGALLAVLAQPLRKRRRALLGAGSIAVVAGAVLAIEVAVLA
jgi:hypothetical protein